MNCGPTRQERAEARWYALWERVDVAEARAAKLEALLALYRAKRAVDGGGYVPRVYDALAHFKADEAIAKAEKEID